MSRGDPEHDRLIITAASEPYATSLLALLGSLNLNWPAHPPVLVYDIGLELTTLERLRKHNVPVQPVPAFCPHWRQHFTWKLWCLDDAPARDVLWLDAGLVVLEPLDEIFDALASQGYFLTTNGQLLDWEASERACAGCGVTPDFRHGKPTLPGTLMGFRKSGATLEILRKALAVGMVEQHIAATDAAHRHDQAIISLLVYKHLGRVTVADRSIYLGSSPGQVPGQKVWVHRRSIRPADVIHLAGHISRPGQPYRPAARHSQARATALGALYDMSWHFGRDDRAAAREKLELAFRTDPALRDEPRLLGRRLRAYRARLGQFRSPDTQPDDIGSWAVEQLREIAGQRYADLVAQRLRDPRRRPRRTRPHSLLSRVVEGGQLLVRRIAGRSPGQ